MNITRVYTGDDGRSHFEELTVDMVDKTLMGMISDPWSATAVQFREVDADYELDFHNAPRRQLVVNLTGSVEIETGSGDKRMLGPGSILLAEDTDGEGHISRNGGDGPRTCLFIHLPAD
jgi:hypothetical protein